MARLTAPNGSVVNVSDDLAERLVNEQGFKSAGGESKATAKKSSSTKK